MDLDLAKLSTNQLKCLNHQIVDILKTRRQRETYKALADFEAGDHVEFDNDDELVKGYVVRVNKKTVTIDAYEPHGHWRVGPSIVRKVEGSSDVPGSSNVFDLFQRP